MSLIVENKNCLICGSKNLLQYLDLGRSALANSYLSKNELKKKEFKAPLRVAVCKKCHLVQLMDIVDRSVLFRDYAYFSSTSPQLLDHFGEYAKDIFKRFPDQAKSLTLEIASNDGILLKPLKKLGANVLGIDPAKNIALQANREGITTIPEFFGPESAAKILKQYGRAGVVIANNVLAHTDNIHKIISGVDKLLSRDGVFVFEVQYLADLMAHNEFDNTYHEHTCYYSLLPLVRLLKDYSMKIFDVKHVDTQGGSLRVYVGRKPLKFAVSLIVGEMIKREKVAGFDKEEAYLAFSQKPSFVRSGLVRLLADLKKKNKKIVGYGAPAKGNTLLQYCGIGRETIDYVTDNAPSKQGKYTPGSHLPIVSPDRLRKDIPDYILILAWNYSSSIVNREKWFSDRGGRFIVPIPEPKIL